MSKQTAGPWAVGDFDDFNEKYSVIQAGSVRRGPGYVVQTLVCEECSEADAHLIAEAPALLGDLIDAAAQLRTYEALHRTKNTEESTAKAEVNAALAARFEATIARARGEP